MATALHVAADFEIVLAEPSLRLVAPQPQPPRLLPSLHSLTNTLATPLQRVWLPLIQPFTSCPGILQRHSTTSPPATTRFHAPLEAPTARPVPSRSVSVPELD